MLLHDAPDFADLIAVTARQHGIDPGLVEKDYWIMRALHYRDQPSLEATLTRIADHLERF